MPPHSGLSEEEYQDWLKKREEEELKREKRNQKKIERKYKKWREECRLASIALKKKRDTEERLKKRYLISEFTSFLDTFHNISICKCKVDEYFRFDEESDDYLDDTKDEDIELRQIIIDTIAKDPDIELTRES